MCNVEKVHFLQIISLIVHADYFHDNKECNATSSVAERMWKERRGVENGNCATNKQTIIGKWEGDLNWVPATGCAGIRVGSKHNR